MAKAKAKTMMESEDGFKYESPNHFDASEAKVIHAIANGLLDDCITHLALVAVGRAEHLGKAQGLTDNLALVPNLVAATDAATKKRRLASAKNEFPTEPEYQAEQKKAVNVSLVGKGQVDILTGDRIDKNQLIGRKVTIKGKTVTIIGCGRTSVKYASDPEDRNTHKFLSVHSAKRAGWLDGAIV